MKRALYILTIFLAAGCARPVYTSKNDMDAAYMRGNIFRIRETVIDDPSSAELPATLSGFDVYTEITYNRAGNIVLMESFRGPDSLRFVREEFFYDTSGEKMVRSASHNLNKNSVRILEYEYDKDGNLASEREATGSYSVRYGYDCRGYLKKERNIAVEEGYDEVTRYRYDSRGRLKQAKGNPSKTYSYHHNGVVAVIYTGKDVVERYNEKGSLTEVSNIIRRTDGEGRGKGSFTVSITAVYEYDDRGNWIKRTQKYEGRSEAVTFRTIEYYPE